MQQPYCCFTAKKKHIFSYHTSSVL